MADYKTVSKNINFFGKRTRLLMGDDHLLLVNYLFGAEEYRRFFFKDLRSITVFRSVDGLIFNIISGSLTAFFVLLATVGFGFYASGNNNDAAFGAGVFFAIIAFLIGIYFFVNLSKGPTSKVKITTLNSTDTVVLTGYFNKTLKLLNRMRPLIIKQQGNFSQDELIGRLRKE